FDNRDTPDSPPVVLIDEKFAQRFWQHEDPIGKHLWFDPKKPMTIVGVVGTVKQYGLDIDGKIVVYFPHAQGPAGRMYVVARTSSEPAGMAAAMAREIHAVDRNVPIYQGANHAGPSQRFAGAATLLYHDAGGVRTIRPGA